MDLSAYTISELETLAAAALSDDAEKIRTARQANTDRILPIARRVNAAYGDRPVGWDHSGRA